MVEDLRAVLRHISAGRSLTVPALQTFETQAIQRILSGMKIIVKEDGEGYLARVRESENLFAYGLTKDEALDELSGVIDMTMDFFQSSGFTCEVMAQASC